MNLEADLNGPQRSAIKTPTWINTNRLRDTFTSLSLW
jgi:hypothetical protein